jgi:hypothetical protein
MREAIWAVITASRQCCSHLTLTTGQKNEEIACFEELVFLSDLLKAFLELRMSFMETEEVDVL